MAPYSSSISRQVKRERRRSPNIRPSGSTVAEIVRAAERLVTIVRGASWIRPAWASSRYRARSALTVLALVAV
jgi:hypothetical protein